MVRTTPRKSAAQLSVDRQILSTNVRPVSYDLAIEPNLKEGNFSGSVSIVLYVLQYTEAITLNAGSSLDILKTELSKDDESVECHPLERDTTNERLIIRLKHAQPAPAKLILKHTFTGTLLAAGRGFYSSPTGTFDENGEPKLIASVILEPIDARLIFPCFDEPGLKAKFIVTIIVPEAFTALSNMPISTEVAYPTSTTKKKAVTFQPTPPMSTYLLSLAVGKLDFIETNSFHVPVRIYAASGRNMEHARSALEFAASALRQFEDTFDLGFPLPKMDFFAVPGKLGVGAVENWGCIMFEELELFLDDEETSAAASAAGVWTIFHELAHQWFGNIVTMDKWDSTWLNEGFATWACAHALNSVKPDWYPWADYLSGRPYQVALSIDSKRSSHPVEFPVKRDSEITVAFDNVSYGKGSALMRMLSDYLGEEIFLEGVNRYLKANLYGSASSERLWEALEEVSGEDVGEMMRVWTKTVGFPVVEVVEDDYGTVLVTQHRFLKGKDIASEEDFVYPLSLKVRIGDDVKRVPLLDRHTTFHVPKSHQGPDNFYKINFEQAGLYHVCYPPERLEILTENIQDGLLSVEDRIGLITDTLAMSSSGHLSTKTSSLLTLLRAFPKETNYFVLKQLLTTVSTTLDTWIFQDSRTVDALERFQLDLVSSSLPYPGSSIHVEHSDSMLEQMSKALLFEHAAAHPKVKEDAERMFLRFVAGDRNAININILETVLKIVLRGDNAPLAFEAILDLHRNHSTPHTSHIYLLSLGFVEHDELIDRVLEIAMREEIIATGETYSIIAALTSHKVGKEKVWEWFKKNAEAIERAFGKGRDRGGRIIAAVVGGLGTREQVEDVKRWFEGFDMKADKYYLAQAIEGVEEKVRWVERDEGDVRDWLDDHGYLAYLPYTGTQT